MIPARRIIKRIAYEVFDVMGRNPLIDIALECERIALEDDYFMKRRLYPNVDFYTGLIYQSMGFPVTMFPVLFAIPRTSGWIAQWEEMLLDMEQKISRPRQVYLGAGKAVVLRRPLDTPLLGAQEPDGGPARVPVSVGVSPIVRGPCRIRARKMTVGKVFPGQSPSSEIGCIPHNLWQKTVHALERDPTMNISTRVSGNATSSMSPAILRSTVRRKCARCCSNLLREKTTSTCRDQLAEREIHRQRGRGFARGRSKGFPGTEKRFGFVRAGPDDTRGARTHAAYQGV